MDVYEAVDSRRAVRAFRPDPVPRPVLERVLQAATRAPSSGNLQPWRVFVTAGEPLAELKRRATGRALADAMGAIYLPLPYADAAALSRAVRAVTVPARTAA